MNRKLLYLVFVVIPAAGTVIVLLSMGASAKFFETPAFLYIVIGFISPVVIYRFSNTMMKKFTITGFHSIELYFLVFTLALTSLFVNGSALFLRKFTGSLLFPLSLIFYELIITLYYVHRFKAI